MNPWVQGSQEAFHKAWAGRRRVAGSTWFLTFIVGCLICGGLATLLDRTIGLPSMPGRWAMITILLIILPLATVVIVVAVRLSNRPDGMVAVRCLWTGVLLRYRPDVYHYDSPDEETPADWIVWPIGLRRAFTLPCYANGTLMVADLVIDGVFIRLAGVRPARPDECHIAGKDPSIRYDYAARMLTVG